MIRCLIVDDEPLARRVIENYITRLPSLECVQQCANAIEAASYLHSHSVDVMFLDIKMPEMTGLDFLKTLAHPPQVILTTAYSEYALEGYEYSVTDYLLKPIAFERFLKAVNKIQVSVKHESSTTESSDDGFILLKEDKVEHQVPLIQIHYIEGCGNFVRVFIDDREIIVAETMTHMQSRLPEDRFIRVHKSYIISLARIEQIEGNMIRMSGKTIPIGRTYKIHLENILQKYRLNSN